MADGTAETNVITQFNPSGALPKERHLHTAVFSSSGEMTVFAGHLYAGVEFASDMWVWHNSSQTWSEVQYANSPPPPRAAHSAATVGDLMYVYGGTGPNATDSDAPNITYNDLWTFNFSTLMWTQISTAIDIGPRTGIVSGAHGHDLYLYGGQDGLSNAYGDFWKLDTTSNSWDLVFEYPNPSFNSFCKPLQLPHARVFIFTPRDTH
jgi:N-acetylneuraminic acid mutarotase